MDLFKKMIRSARIVLLGLSVTAFLPDSGYSQTRMPQDNWYLYKTFGGSGSGPGQFNNPQGICIGPNDEIIIADTYNNRVQIFSDSGNLLASFASSRPNDVEVSETGTIFVTETQANRVAKYDLSGNFLEVYTSFNSPSEFARRADGLSALAYYDNVAKVSKIVFLDSGGSLVATRSASPYPVDMEFDESGKLVMLEMDGYYYDLEIISEDGIHEESFDIPDSYHRDYSPRDPLAVGPDGRVFVFNPRYPELFVYRNYSDGPVFRLRTSGFGNCESIAVTGKGDLILLSGNTVRILRNCFRTMGPLTRNATPIPHVESVDQRVNTTSLDIDYRITDRDDATVDVAALALIGGGENLNNVVRIQTLLEGTDANVGNSIAANATHRLTWNAGADWGVDFGTVTINIFAKDSRQGLLDLHLLHMPFEGGETLVINRYPIFHSDLLNVWYWLLANGDARIVLASGEIRGVGGEFDGDLLASGTNTTQRGREFLFGLMGVREATAQELTKAREAATPGMVNQWDPVLQVGPGERPKKVNEYGFDTGDYSGIEAWWVVKDTP